MEDRRFDSWTRTLGAARSRRQAMRALAGAAVGGALAAVGRDAAAATDCPRFSLCWFGQRATASALKKGGLVEGTGPANEVCNNCGGKGGEPPCRIKCSAPYVVDKSICDCVCALSCPSGKVPNADCSGCVCASGCGAGYVQDAGTCGCACPSGQIDCGRGCQYTPCCNCIVPGTYLDSSGCNCICPATGQPICPTAGYGWVCCPPSTPFCRLGPGGNGCFATTS